MATVATLSGFGNFDADDRRSGDVDATALISQEDRLSIQPSTRISMHQNAVSLEKFRQANSQTKASRTILIAFLMRGFPRRL